MHSYHQLEQELFSWLLKLVHTPLFQLSDNELDEALRVVQRFKATCLPAGSVTSLPLVIETLRRDNARRGRLVVVKSDTGVDFDVNPIDLARFANGETSEIDSFWVVLRLVETAPDNSRLVLTDKGRALLCQTGHEVKP